MVMIFAHPRVRAYLLEHERVYSFRKLHKKTPMGIRPQIGRDWATDKRCGKKIVDINITPVKAVGPTNMEGVLTEYVRESGFYKGSVNEAVEEWICAINDLNSEIPYGWIYKVEVREAHQ